MKVYADDKMYVPGDSFGGKSPEAYMSERMRTFFTFVAVKYATSNGAFQKGNLTDALQRVLVGSQGFPPFVRPVFDRFGLNVGRQYLLSHVEC